ncbi:MAG: hypothetical protein JKY56_26250 [Kofleriaceae bacterium]|nr:hypothetical protein [Kofleriaceae bacterium]
MSLAIDSLVTDLMFQSGDALDPEVLVEVLGGQDKLAEMQIIDPDMQDPQFEMQISPSMPFRRRDERRLMIVDDSVAPMRKKPQEESIVPLDLRGYKEKLVELCTKVPVRMGRLFALGSWGDAVWIVRSYRDLRGLCLISWALDPTTDIEGRRRAAPLGQREFEEKLLSYDKRLDELGDEQIVELLGDDVRVEEVGELIIVDMLEEDGTWDTAKSLKIESRIAAIDKFSSFVGAKHIPDSPKDATPDVPDTHAEPVVEPEVEAEVEAAPITPLRLTRLDDSIVVIFTADRFGLDTAASLGKKDWDSILTKADNISGQDKDQLYRHGGDFVAPIEFLSEVFVEGKPLSKKQFEAGATISSSGAKTMEVHFPRFGPVVLIAQPGGARFVSSKLDATNSLLELIG